MMLQGNASDRKFECARDWANILFSFEPEKRGIKLQQGSILFNSFTGKGGGNIRTAAVTASVLGTTLLVDTTNHGGFKVMLLKGKGRIRTAAGKTRTLTTAPSLLWYQNALQPFPVTRPKKQMPRNHRKTSKRSLNSVTFLCVPVFPAAPRHARPSKKCSTAIASRSPLIHSLSAIQACPL